MNNYMQIGIPKTLAGTITVTSVGGTANDSDGSIGGKAGARNNRQDAASIQAIHDSAVALGAMCQEREEGELEEGMIKVKAAEMSFSDMSRRVRDAWYAHARSGGTGILIWRDVYSHECDLDGGGLWVHEIYPNRLIVKLDAINKFFAYDYAVDAAGGFTFGSPYEVRQEWVNVALADEMSEGNELKAIKETDNELRVANHIVLFGDEKNRDLEGLGSRRTNPDGSIGEYFTAKTILDSAYTENNLVAQDWEHGEDSDVDHPDPELKSPGRDDILGYVDWSTAKATKQGVWVERVLNKRNKYVQWLKQLIEDGLIGTSSEPVQKGVKKSASGEILAWPLYRDTLTIKPMEWRMMSENTLQALKALAQADVQAAKAIIEQSENMQDGEIAGAIRQRVAVAKAQISKKLLSD